MANIKTVLDNVASGAIKLAASGYKDTYTPISDIEIEVIDETGIEGLNTRVIMDGAKNGEVEITDVVATPQPQTYPFEQAKMTLWGFEGAEGETTPFKIPNKKGKLQIAMQKIEDEKYGLMRLYSGIYPDIFPPVDFNMVRETEGVVAVKTNVDGYSDQYVIIYERGKAFKLKMDMASYGIDAKWLIGDTPDGDTYAEGDELTITPEMQDEFGNGIVMTYMVYQ